MSDRSREQNVWSGKGNRNILIKYLYIYDIFLISRYLPSDIPSNFFALCKQQPIGEPNTREEIFDAMMRREVFATTGTRMRLRMFASWNFTAADKDLPDLARTAYAKGVPMGSDLTGRSAAPTFLIEAMRDPDGANLDRIQIVKGWIDDKGKMQEGVFDVVWSGNRKPGKNGKLPNVGNTVKGATYRNSIGSPVLSAFWRDPSHRAGERAFYYARVLEIPTPIWLAYDMVQIGQRALPKDARLVHQERGYGSPIWVGSK